MGVGVLNFGVSLAEMLGQHFCRVGFFMRWGVTGEKLEKPVKNTKFCWVKGLTL
jgi:hypothetical protein